MSFENIELYSSADFVDNRGKLTYFPNLDFSKIKRTYIIEPINDIEARAWQGHKVEEKWFLLLNGSFKIVFVKPDDWSNPSLDLTTSEFILTDKNLGIIHLPSGYASGFIALQKNSRLMVFSNFTTDQSKKDDYRFDKNLWYNW